MTVKRYGAELILNLQQYRQALVNEVPSITKKGADRAALAFAKSQQRVYELDVKEKIKTEHAKTRAALKEQQKVARAQERQIQTVEDRIFKLYQEQRKEAMGTDLFNLHQDIAEINDLQDEMADLNMLTERNVKLLEQRRDAARTAFVDKLQGSKASSTTAISGQRKATAELATVTADATKKTSAFAQVNRNLSYQVFDVIQSVQAGQDPMRALSIQLSDVGFQYAGAAASAGSFGKIIRVGGPVALGLAAVGTAALVVANYTADARAEMTAYKKVINDTTVSSRALSSAQMALAGAEGDVAGFVANLQIETAAMRGEITQGDLAAGQLAETLGTQLRPRLEAAGQAVADNEMQIQRLSKALKSGKLNVDETAKATLALSKARATRPELLAELAEIKELHQDGRVAINAYANAMDEEGDKTDAATGALDRHTDALARLREEQAVGDAIRSKMLQQITNEKDAHEALRAIITESLSDQLSAYEKINAQYDAQVASLDAIAAKTDDVEGLRAAHAEIEARRLRDLQAESRRVKDERDAEDDAAQLKIRQRAEETARLQVQYGEQALEGLAAMSGQIGGLMADGARKGGAALIAVQKAVALKNILISAKETFARSLAITPAPAGLPVAFGNAALVMAQQGAVEQIAPSFDIGGKIRGGMMDRQSDSMTVNVLPNEGVLNTTAMANMGEDELNARNAGRVPTSGGTAPAPWRHFGQFWRERASGYGVVSGSMSSRVERGRFVGKG